jgi:hypothetical protein
MPVRPSLVVFLLLAAAAFAGAACGSDGTEERSLPPNDLEQLADVFDAELEPLGLKLTRGALIDTSNGRYRPSDTGRHLAVYVEPTGEYTTAEYAKGIVPSAQVFLPEVFERWDLLETFDVCQEPLPVVDDRKEPPPVTQLFLSRAEAGEFDWKDVTLAELLAAREPERASFTLYVAPAVTNDPSWLSLSRAG